MTTVPDETRQLAQFIVDLSDSDIPVELRKRMGYLIVDNLASGYLGSRQSCTRMAAAMVARFRGDGDAHVFGSPGGLDASRASFLNGVAIGAFETDHTAHGAHAGGAVFPAVLALGEELGASGETIMRALVAGYEVNIRVAAAQTNRAEQVRGFHNPGISGPFGSAAGCSLLLGLSLDQTLSALGIAGSHSGGLIEYVWSGAMTKRMHLGRAAQMGLESALLASEGFTGPPTILEGEYGYLQAYSPEPKIELLLDRLGSHFRFQEFRVKPYAGHGSAQPFIPILDEWRRRGIDPSQIEEVHIATSEHGAEKRFQDTEPKSLLGAQYSLPFTIAVVLARGIDGLIDLDEKVLDDQSLRQLATRVTIAEDDRYQGNAISAGGEVVLTVNGAIETMAAPGIPQYSLEDLQELCRGKLERYSRGLVPADRIAKLEEIAENIEGLDSIGELTELVFTS